MSTPRRSKPVPDSETVRPTVRPSASRSATRVAGDEEAATATTLRTTSRPVPNPPEHDPRVPWPSTAPAKAPALDTRSRILQSAQRLFRKRGYHATGLNDILELAQAPKGSMYHHFPGGKEEIGVIVIEQLTRGLIGLFEQSRARSAQAMVREAGEQLVTVAEKTEFEICALYASFVAERKSSPLLGAAVSAAYGQMLEHLQARMQRDGMPARLAGERAQLVVAMLEGGSLLAQARQDASLFRATVKQAALLCAVDGGD